MSAPNIPVHHQKVVIWRELLMPAVMLAFAAYLGWGIAAMEVPDSAAFPGPRFFPAIITAGLVIFSALDIADIFRRAHVQKINREQVEEQVSEYTAPIMIGAAQPTHRIDVASLGWTIGGFLFFTLSLKFLGWVIAAGLLFWLVARGFGAHRPVLTLVIGLTVSSFAYIVFDMVLGLSLPSGILGGGF
ncbi:tripartite tricarboxylate transporter TctB family protein [Rothia sp. LK2588]|uniref:tripartite tricarboxylate transporter TctB family protein n=1 Tax=Rothia sp. LK2588 TaxID=3114369 RepID=UPI0034CD3E76